MKGSTYRRCACRNPETGKQWGQSCPKLTSRRHGVWYFRQELPAGTHKDRRTLRKGGYESATDAQAGLDKVRAIIAVVASDDPEGQDLVAELLEAVVRDGSPFPEPEEVRRRMRTGQSLTERITVGEWLDKWLASRKTIRRNTYRRYECEIRMHMKPRIGHLRLDRLRVSHLAEMFQSIADANEEIVESNAQRKAAIAELAEVPWKGKAERAKRKRLKTAIDEMPPFRRVVGPATRHRMRATLRKALNDAIGKEELITFNPAAHVELDTFKRPKALVWTAERIERWQRTGEKPSPVMVWTPAQTGQFLDHVHDDPLYALWHLIAFRGLRRGEGCGLREEDVELDAKSLTVAQQLVLDGWTVEEGEPKTESGERVVALDKETVTVLRRYRARKAAARLEWGTGWVETGRFFTREDGSMLHPGWVSERFERLVAESGLPPIRLHDLRHGAATISLAAGADMKTVQEMLGHSSITVTSDVYTTVLPEVALAAAEAASKLVPRTQGLTTGSLRPTGTDGKVVEINSGKTSPQLTGGELG
jgi:integrase